LTFVLAAGVLLMVALIEPTTARADAFTKPWALAGYAVGGGGDYGSVGIGGRIRWELLPGTFGLEVFGQQTAIDWPGPERMDHVGGFALYMPFRLGQRVRVRPLAGFCAMLSRVDPARTGLPRDDDVLTGVHGGVGVEAALTDRLVLFADAETWAYVGNAEAADGWSRIGSLGVATIATATVGLSIVL